jgi:hypothetical protein
MWSKIAPLRQENFRQMSQKMRFTGALFKDLTQDELQTPPLFPKLDMTIKKGQPTQVRFSHTYIIAICQNQTEQLFCLIVSFLNWK